jgi:hypothetical protein
MVSCRWSISKATLVLLVSLVTVPLDGCRIEPAVAASGAVPARPGVRSQRPGKRALIVAISNYDPASSWPAIHSTNDIPLVQEALQTQGFQVDVLPEIAATAKGIVQAFRKDLIDPAQPGDVTVFHFSGHGRQITDNDGDEVDGFDEALVPYDAPMNPVPSDDGSRYLRDDVLHGLLQELRRKVGPQGNVVVFLDSCFSGAGARGQNVRGGVPPLGPPRPGHTKEARGQMGSGFFMARGAAAGEEAELSPYIVFSAARADQVDQEIVDPSRDVLVGPLSWAVSRALTTLRGEPTYRNLFDEVQSLMREQFVPGEPQLEGNADTKIFSGQAVKQAPFIRIASAEADGKKVVLAMGALGNLLPGAEVEIHKAGTLNPKPASRLAIGKVDKASPFEAVVKLDRAVARAQLERGRAFVTRYAFGDLRMRVQIKDLGDPALRSEIVNTLRDKVASAELVDSNPEVVVELVPPGTMSTISVSTATGTVVLPPIDRSTPDLADKVCNRLLDLARNRYMSRLSFADPRFQYSFKVIPVTVSDCNNPSRPTLSTCQVREIGESRVSVGNQMQLPIGSFYKIRIYPGEVKAYGTLLDLMADGQIEIYWPPPNEKQQFKTNSPTELDALYQVTEPPGIEKLLFIATQSPTDFEPFRTSPTLRGRGEPKGEDLENLGAFAPLFNDLTVRGRGRVSFSLDGIATHSLQYTVFKP